MKTLFLKILSLFFVALVLCTNVLNLHIYTHQDAQEHCLENSDSEDHNKSESCELCLLAINLNNLDYLEPSDYFREDIKTLVADKAKNIFADSNTYYKQIALTLKRNKAPPYFI